MAAKLEINWKVMFTKTWQLHVVFVRILLNKSINALRSGDENLQE